MRRLAVLIALASLSACNVVLTKTPLFTAADTAGAPVMRPGIWVFFKEPGCALDERAPIATWPDCAGGGIVGDGHISGHPQNTPPSTLQTTPFLLAAGDPRIAQVQVTIDMSAGATASGPGATASASPPAHAAPWAYAGVRPTKFDPQGRIVAFNVWPVQCGPPPPQNSNAITTKHLLKGLEMAQGDTDCSTSSKDALRAAAKASEAWADQPRQSHWVRDGDH